jgi:hypothetical protein
MNRINISTVFRGSALFLMTISGVLKANAQLYGDFPYNQSFTSGSQPPEVTAPTGAGTNAVAFTSNGMLLTPAVNGKFGAVFINNKQFSSNNGIKISFEYSIYGGNGADGISVFLFDAGVTNPEVGSIGAGLGYSYNRSNNQWPANRKKGLTGGYLSIGLDAYGNNKNLFFQGEARRNGVAAPGAGWSQYISHVTLRGAIGDSINNTGLGTDFTGSPVLITKSTLAAAANGGAVLNTLGGGYTYTGGTPDNFNLRPGTFTTSPSDPNYRKAFIDLMPNALGGFNITVKIQHGTVTSTIIDNYWYRTSFTYTENANPATSDFNTSNTQGASTTHTLDAAVPDFFRIGFAAATGGLNDNHLIRNLTVLLPYAAEVLPDSAATCKGNAVTLSPLSNDLAYAGLIAAPTASSSNINKSTFRFHELDNTVSANAYNVSNAQGTWAYNSTTGQVLFTPAAGFSGVASIRYSLKGNGTPYSDEAYRSATTTLTVVVNNTPAAPTVGSVTPASNGMNNGAVTLTGLPTPGNWTINETPGSLSITGSGTSATFSGLPGGSHSFTVTDANGCTSLASTTSVPLPVAMLYFHAVKDGAYARLDWATAAEHNTRGFYIERSRDSRSWENIGFVATKAARGNSTEKIAYNFRDKASLQGRCLYRLNQVDLDGASRYSNTAILVWGTEGNIVLYPNPAQNRVTVSGLTGKETILIYNTIGQLVYKNREPQSSQAIDLHSAAKGLYNVSVIDEQGDLKQTFKLILQ